MLSAEQIARAEAVNIGDVASERGFALDRAGNHAGPCPRCGGKDRFSIYVRKSAFLCRQCHPKGGGGAIRLVMFLDGCGFREAVETLIGKRNAPVKSKNILNLSVKDLANYDRRQREKAAWLWSQRLPITDSVAESYLRKIRGITCTLPSTLAFLPVLKREHHPAMISAFGICDEVEPGIIAVPREIAAIHLTLLKTDGSGKAEIEPNKIMIGSPGGKPIIVAAANDLLGLTITEGIEDALSAHQATGLGAWVAGAAGFMPKLASAVPDYIDCITINAHADKAGQDGAYKLAAKLRARGIEAIIEGLAA
jgi:hypothetical protein